MNRDRKDWQAVTDQDKGNKMARIAGVDLPRNKQVRIALTYIYGIGDRARAKILDEANVDPFDKVQDLGRR